MTVPFNLSRRAGACLSVLLGFGALSSLSAQSSYTEIYDSFGTVSEIYSFDHDYNGESQVLTNNYGANSSTDIGSGILFLSFDLTFNSTVVSTAEDFSTSISLENELYNNITFTDNRVYLSLGGASAYTDLVINDTDTLSVFAILDKAADGTYDNFSLWIGNPSTSATLTIENGTGMNMMDYWSINSFGLGSDSSFTYSDLVISTASAIPEPSTWALGIGFLAIGGFIYRRRRQ